MPRVRGEQLPDSCGLVHRRCPRPNRWRPDVLLLATGGQGVQAKAAQAAAGVGGVPLAHDQGEWQHVPDLCAELTDSRPLCPQVKITWSFYQVVTLIPAVYSVEMPAQVDAVLEVNASCSAAPHPYPTHLYCPPPPVAYP